MPNVYNGAKGKIGQAGLDLATASFECMLMTTGYTYDPDDAFVADVSANELSVGGYSRQPMTGLIPGPVGNDWLVNADQVTFATLDAGQTIGSAIVFEVTGNDATAVLVAYYDVTDVPTNGGDVTIRFGGSNPGPYIALRDL